MYHKFINRIDFIIIWRRTLASRDYRRFKLAKFNNILILGEYEKALSPWTINFLCGFKIKPTEHSEGEINIHDLRQLLAKQVLGKQALERAASPLVPTGFGFWGMRHAYEHNPAQIEYGRWSDMQIEFFVICPPEYEQSDDKKGMEAIFNQLAKKFAAMQNFQSTKFYEIKPSKNVK